MQGAKKAGESIKETAANIGASAKSGMEKTKATVQEKTEKMTARDPLQKEIATQKKETKMDQAELDKLAAREHNAAVKQANAGEHMVGQGPHHHHNIGTGTTTTTGAVGSHPIGANTGTGRTTTAHNPRSGVNPTDQGYGARGTYT
ncbi:hypothetical protein Lal_00004080 [Lupinus albus]|uniref:Putative Late embryogenesis abundant protein, LEA-25/LEA-D113 n=1 Tax=Lupinus albus TaxID=3870 RepID=A0A6A4PE68_LUPAL|nr:putative Late embryogenesis abundant protein, LEA-25/LEA-D113 [Lupinus albus]KAF1894159.1 hypothetical protein Lal_00004080 [Lupinus albus]